MSARSIQALDALGRGDWRAVHPPERWISAGSGEAFLVEVLIGVVADAMRLAARGDVEAAWDLYDGCAARLPLGLRVPRPSGGVRARCLLPRPDLGEVDEAFRRLAVLVWREQFELEDLRERLRRMRHGHEELVEAVVEYLCWIEMDPFTWQAAPGDDTGPGVERDRAVLLRRATRLRHFADPLTRPVSQSVWQDHGQFRGLCRQALRALAGRPAPVPWQGVAGTRAVPVRLGRRYAWQCAQTWRTDADPGQRPEWMRQ